MESLAALRVSSLAEQLSPPPLRCVVGDKWSLATLVKEPTGEQRSLQVFMAFCGGLDLSECAHSWHSAWRLKPVVRKDEFVTRRSTLVFANFLRHVVLEATATT